MSAVFIILLNKIKRTYASVIIAPPSSPYTYLIDDDGKRLIDDDGKQLIDDTI